MMATQSANGRLTSFSGMFGIAELEEHEKSGLEEILHTYATGKQNISSDLITLIAITSEVKAINNQAALLHGERVKKAHSLLTTYKEGAFTAWMIRAYGNRQTPYNLMRYYEFYEALPKNLRPQLESMPRQAVYTLATREGEFQKKQHIVECYSGENKIQLLIKIRDSFPLDQSDQRRQDMGQNIIDQLERLMKPLEAGKQRISKQHKQTIQGLLDQFKELVEECKQR